MTRFRPLDDGWYAWSDAGVRDASVDVRLQEAVDGRLRIVGLRVHGAVSAGLLRSIPVGRIEAAANAQLHHGAPAPLARRPRARIRTSLRPISGRGYPDGFYEEVASVYRHLVASSSRPVAELAAANDVPGTTAQRWVKEARRRGFLAPGQPGKAG